MYRKITYSIIILCASIGLHGQSIVATLDSSTILIGDQVHFTLKASIPKGMTWTLPTFDDTLVNGVEILEQKGPDTSYLSDGSTEIKLTLLITSFDSAHFVIPPIPLQVGWPGDTSIRIVWSDANLLSVYTLPVDMEKSYFDIKDLIPFPITLREAIRYTLIGLAGAFVLLLIVYSISRIRQGKSIIPAFRKPEPPHVIALRELESLRILQLWQKGEVKEYYVRLSQILRSYIEGRFGLPALESTSDEIRESFREHRIVAGLQIELNDFFDRSDMVKFAKALPLADEHALSFKAIEAFIRDTMPVEGDAGAKGSLTNSVV